MIRIDLRPYINPFKITPVFASDKPRYRDKPMMKLARRQHTVIAPNGEQVEAEAQSAWQLYNELSLRPDATHKILSNFRVAQAIQKNFIDIEV